jgi:hypothetical protein
VTTDGGVRGGVLGRTPAWKPNYACRVIAFAAVMLLVSAVWSFVVWPPFLRRIRKDPRAHDEAGRGTRFLTVHVVLISTSLLIAALCAVAGILLLVG